MARSIVYPTPERIVEYNAHVLKVIKVKKADRAEVLSLGTIVKIIQECKNIDGDIYDKAVGLIKGLIQGHAFASGNRRTAFVAANESVNLNGGLFNIPDNPAYARVMQGIREGYYTDEEIKRWIKNGKIREFKR